MRRRRQNPRHSWSPQQVRDFVRDLQKEFGSAWSTLLTSRIQAALVAEACLVVVRSQHCGDVSTDAVNALLVDMEIEAGLRDPEKAR